MKSPFAFGIIGCGIIGQRVAERVSSSLRADLKAVADLDRAKAEQVTEKFGGKAYIRTEEMLGQEELDIVLIATPDAHHKEPTLQVASAGVPFLFLQKPLATTVEDARAMVEVLEASETQTYMLFTNRFDYMDMATRYVIQEGLLGRPIYGEARLDDNIFVPTHAWGPRSRQWAEQSSPAQFLLSHVVDQLRWFFEPAEIEGVYAIEQREVLGYTPDLFDAFLFLSSGVKVRIKSEWIKHMRERVEFYLSFGGDLGSLIYHKLPAYGTQLGWRAYLDETLAWDDLLKHHQRLLDHNIVCSVGLQTGVGRQGDTRLRTLTIEQNGTDGYLDVLFDAVEEKSDSPTSFTLFGRLPGLRDGLRATEVVCAIHESAATRREVALHL